MVNIRQKGQTGEREVCHMLNDIVLEVNRTLGKDVLADVDLPFQRNQNQSAVGGSDITNPYGLSIEVKRQEQLSINTWWKQCTVSAERDGGIPILIFKQNRKKWRVMMPTYIQLPNNLVFGPTRSEISVDDFLQWFRNHYLENCR